MSREPFPKSRRLLAEAIAEAEGRPMPPEGPLTQAILDRERCETPGCECADSVMHMVPRCHPRAGTAVLYRKATGVLEMRCRVCKTPVARFKVAER